MDGISDEDMEVLIKLYFSCQLLRENYLIMVQKHFSLLFVEHANHLYDASLTQIVTRFLIFGF